LLVFPSALFLVQFCPMPLFFNQFILEGIPPSYIKDKY